MRVLVVNAGSSSLKLRLLDGEAADAALREHISRAFTTRLRLDAAEVQAGLA